MITFPGKILQNLTSDVNFTEIITGSIWALGARVIATFLGLLSTIIIARFYGADVLGVVALLTSFLALASIIAVMGTGTSILRLIPEHLAKHSPTSAFRVYRKTQLFVIGVSLVSGIIMFLCSALIAETVFSKPNLRIYFSLASFFIVFMSLMQLNTQAVRGLRLIRVFALMQLLPSLSKLIILIPITIFLYHQSNPIYAMLASIFITALVGVWIMDRAFKKKIAPGEALHPVPMKELLTISMPMLMTAVMTFVIGQTGIIMLGIFRSQEEVGYYAVAVSLASLTSFILSAINTMVAPKFSELFHSGKMDELFHIAQKSAKLIFWTTFPILITLILLGKPIIAMLYGADFKVAYMAMVFLVIGQFVHSISGSTGIFMNMTGNQHSLRNILFISALINVTMSFALIPNYGMHGSATAASFSILFWNSTVVYCIKKKYRNTISYLPVCCNTKKTQQKP
ncbi:flippase [Desulfonatronum sp. SC1]|uniref:flippase n=1 Tax=Desulfonatronum sp. SC1 TaxID=2109626 RepID=UPI000D31BDE1|nr:flippase [Desulfonatronum sp. SC1]PTN38075.1 flippase [Desulfonatronum sp. SC1]